MKIMTEKQILNNVRKVLEQIHTFVPGTEYEERALSDACGLLAGIDNALCARMNNGRIVVVLEDDVCYGDAHNLEESFKELFMTHPDIKQIYYSQG